MKIKFNKVFNAKFKKQMRYIENDKPMAARRFYEKVLIKINEIPQRPFSYRKSKFSNNENVRELIVQGYVIVFSIENEEIVITNFIKGENF